MFTKVREMLIKHIKKNINIYFFLLLTFIIGVSAGAFTVNGLSTVQREELVNYFQGFLQLMDNQKIESTELLKISLMENMKKGSRLAMTHRYDHTLQLGHWAGMQVCI